MEKSIGSRFKNAWNAFFNGERDPTPRIRDFGASYSYRPDRFRFTRGNERSIVNSIYNKIALDCASIDIKHVRLDETGRYTEDINSSLNRCFNLSANTDQSGFAFKQDLFLSLLDEGNIAVVPIDTDTDLNTGSCDILSLRVAKITAWYPNHVKVLAYDERDGRKKELVYPKSAVAIIENPFYLVMNEPNSIMQRLIRKLNILDVIDEQSGSGKLDLIIQLPYGVKTETKREMANNRLDDIQKQLVDSKYGIAYIDATEHITQLNRPVENNLMKQIEYLTSMLYSQLGLTQGVMDGSADDKTMTNYYTRTVGMIMDSAVAELNRAFLSQTAISQHQAIRYFRDPFKLVPVTEVPEIADKLTRNEIMTSNEVRQIIGLKPSDDPGADELRNKNINQSNGELGGIGSGSEDDSIVNDMLASLETTIDEILGENLDEEGDGDE